MAENITIARPYAKACFATALSQGALPEWQSFLDALALIVTDKEAAKLIDSPKLTQDQKVSFLVAVAEKLAGGFAKGGALLKLLAERKRLLLLPSIAVLFSEQRAEYEKVIAVEIATASSMDESLKQRFTDALVSRLGRRINLDVREDPTLIGGAVIRAGDWVLDGSIRGKIQRLAERLL